jgi:hypothetical protein
LRRRQAEVILRRMDNVLDQLPGLRRQARERVIGGRQVENKEKILRLYESEIHVIVRHKAGATVEPSRREAHDRLPQAARRAKSAAADGSIWQQFVCGGKCGGIYCGS